MAPFSSGLQKVLFAATSDAQRRRHNHLTLEHFLLALTDDNEAKTLFNICALDIETLRTDIQNHLNDHVTKTPFLASVFNRLAGKEPQATVEVAKVLERASMSTESTGKEQVTVGSVLPHLFAESKSHAVHFLKKQKIDRFEMVSAYVTFTHQSAPGSSAAHEATPAHPKTGKGTDTGPESPPAP